MDQTIITWNDVGFEPAILVFNRLKNFCTAVT